MSWRGTSNINRRNDLIKNLALVTQKKKRERESTMVSLHRIFMNVTEEMMFNKKLSVIKVQMRNNETERKSGKLLKGRIHKTWQTNGYFWQENKCHRYHHLPTPHPADTPLEHFTAQPFRKAWSWRTNYLTSLSWNDTALWDNTRNKKLSLLFIFSVLLVCLRNKASNWSIQQRNCPRRKKITFSQNN